MVRGDRGNCILKLRKRPSPSEKGVSSYSREPFLASKKRPLHLQTIVFTPLSIRRGDGGEAFLLYSLFVHIALNTRIHQFVLRLECTVTRGLDTLRKECFQLLRIVEHILSSAVDGLCPHCFWIAITRSET